MEETNRSLKYKTRDMADPRGRPKVFFCCHEKDFDLYFDEITDEIKKYAPNAAIWYYDPKEGIPDDEILSESLGEMQLFVVPVTRRFIHTDNHARLFELPFAVSHNIAVLPLTQDYGLGKEFNSVCGKLQYVDKYSLSQTIISPTYETKVRQFIDSVLVNDESIARIRAAFDGYVFLSYRKKDKLYAQEIIRLIHENDACRDLAIWYDEFLTPGENYSREIEEAIRKSSLFVMVVTPNMLEYSNYVLKNEFPAAKAMGKIILPVEGMKTDSSKLRERFKDIPDMIPMLKVSEYVVKAFDGISTGSRRNDPEHDYLIGLAYLNGIDVETDRERALELITSAAEAGLPEAYGRLVSMYRNGEGVERDYQEALLWQNKLVSFWEGKVKDSDFRDRESVERLDRSLYRLGFDNYDLADYAEAVKAFDRERKLADRLDEMDDLQEDIRMKSNSMLGMCHLQMQNYSEAECWIRKGLDMFDFVQVRRLDTQEKLSSFPVRRHSNNLYDKNVLNRYAELLNSLGNLYHMQGRDDEAEEIFRKIAEYNEFMKTPEKNGVYASDQGLNCFSLGQTCMTRGDKEEALRYFREAVSLLEKAVRERDRNLFYNYEIMARSACNAAEILLEEGSLQEAEDYGSKAVSMQKEVAGNLERDGDYLKLAEYHQVLGEIKYRQKAFREAQQQELESVSICDRLDDSQVRIIKYKALGVLSFSCFELNNIQGGLEIRKRRIELAQEMVNEEPTEAMLYNLGEDCRLMGEIYGYMHEVKKEDVQLKEAISWYERSLDVFKGMSRTEEIDDKIEGIAAEFQKLKARRQPKRNVNIVAVIGSINRGLRPKKADEVSEKYLMNAIASYAPSVKLQDVVAISGTDLFTRGRKGILYTREAFYSDVFGPDEGIRYNDIHSVYLYDEMIEIRTDKKTYRYDDTRHVRQLHEILKRCTAR